MSDNMRLFGPDYHVAFLTKWRLCVITVLYLLAIPCHPLLAQTRRITNRANIDFLPGDAFFHTYVSDEFSVEKLDSNGDIEITYYPPPMSGGFGLSAGYRKLKIMGARDAVHQIIAKFGTPMSKSNGDQYRQDKDGQYSLFVYPKGRDFSKQHIGIKYNSRWLQLRKAERGLERPTTPPANPQRVPHYVTFVVTADAVAEDWRNSGEFDSLEVVPPTDSADPFFFGRPLTSPATIAMKDVIFVLVRPGTINKCFKRSLQARWTEIDLYGNVMEKRFDKEGRVVDVLAKAPE